MKFWLFSYFLSLILFYTVSNFSVSKNNNENIQKEKLKKIIDCKICQEMFHFDFNYETLLKNESENKMIKSYFEEIKQDELNIKDYFSKENLEYILKEISMQYFFKGEDSQFSSEENIEILKTCKFEKLGISEKCDNLKLKLCENILNVEQNTCLDFKANLEKYVKNDNTFQKVKNNKISRIKDEKIKGNSEKKNYFENINKFRNIKNSTKINNEIYNKINFGSEKVLNLENINKKNEKNHKDNIYKFNDLFPSNKFKELEIENTQNKKKLISENLYNKIDNISDLKNELDFKKKFENNFISRIESKLINKFISLDFNLLENEILLNLEKNKILNAKKSIINYKIYILK